MISTRIIALLLALALSTGVISACGGDDNDSSNGEQTAATNGGGAANGEEGDTDEAGAANLADLIEMHPSTVVKRYLVATLTGDGEAACEVLSPAARNQVETRHAEAGDSCEEIVTATAPEPAEGELPTFQIGDETLDTTQISGLELFTTITLVPKTPTAKVSIPGTDEQAILIQPVEEWFIRRMPVGPLTIP